MLFTREIRNRHVVKHIESDDDDVVVVVVVVVALLAALPLFGALVV